MGLVYTDTEVFNIKGDIDSYVKSFLVDTGATDTVISSDELEKIGIIRERKQNYELADGQVVSYDVGFAIIKVEGIKVAANVVFGDKGIEPLLGVTVLETAGLMVDPTQKVLRKVTAIPLKQQKEEL